MAPTLARNPCVDLRDELHKRVETSIRKKAKLLLGNEVPVGEVAWYPPAVLRNVKKDMPAFDDELIGPVATITFARDEEPG